MIIRIIPILFLLSATYSQTIIGDGLTGQPLLDYVVNNYKTSTTLGYANARDTMYSVIDLKDDNQLSCIYSGYTITLDLNEDPSVNAFNQGINCEHTWPQSMGAGQEPQKSDMHHLYPCKSNVNSSRGNHPYAEIPDEDTDIWYRNDYSQDNIPTEFINEYAEKYNSGDAQFEPREDHKGDASRAMFYFFAMYHDVADTNFWNTQKDILLDWHYFDPVGYWEYNRTWSIAVYQENIPNPFVLDSTLSRRIWFFQAQDTSNYNGPVWHVATTGSDTTGDGSEANPFVTIQTGIDSASDGDTVLIHPGIYEGAYLFNKNINLFSLHSTTGDTSYISNTVIDDDGCPLMIYANIDESTRISGFTIQNGTGCVFGQGGGLYIEGSPVVDNLVIKDNNAHLNGGGICVNLNSSPTFRDLIVKNNTGGSGGGIYVTGSTIDMENCVISNNSTNGEGGGVFIAHAPSSPNLVNVTITGNTAAEAGGGIYCEYSNPSLVNSILWNNLPEEIDIYSGTATVTYSDIQGGWEGTGNIDADPLFCNPDSGDYTLAENSPCIGTGENGTNMGAFGVGCSDILAVEEEFIPVQFAIHQNYPNPFNPITTLRYDLPENSHVTITIYDMLGRNIKKLINQTQDAGYKSVIWNATNDYGKPVSAGIYLYQIHAGEYIQTKKMVLLK